MPRRSIKKKKKENVLIVLSSLRCRCPCRRCSRVKCASRRSATDCSLLRVVMSERRPKTSEDDRRKQCAAPRANNPQSESNPSSYRSEMTALLLFSFFFSPSYSCSFSSFSFLFLAVSLFNPQTMNYIYLSIPTLYGLTDSSKSVLHRKQISSQNRTFKGKMLYYQKRKYYTYVSAHTYILEMILLFIPNCIF